MTILTLVVPTYNEAHRWQAEYWADLLTLDGIRWIFVDDGSSDQSHQRLLELPEPTKRQILRLSVNVGKGEAVRAGINHFFDSHVSDEGGFPNRPEHDYGLIGFIDADGSFTKDDISRIFELAHAIIDANASDIGENLSSKFNAVWSSRVALNGRAIERKLLRHYFGRLINTLLSPHISEIPYDPQCGFKIFEASSNFRDCLSTPFKTRWFFDLEIIHKWVMENQRPVKIWEEPLHAWREIPGSHLSSRNIIQIAREILQIILDSRKLTRRTKQRTHIGS